MPVTHLHKSLHLNEKQIVKLVLDKPAIVYLLDNPNYHLFIQDRPYESHGGLVQSFPFLMNPPHPGTWELVIFSSTPGETVRAEISVVER
ncbi:MAG: DUF1883 domain-containing protein [Spirochaetales bacterium]|nr:DUF1883 domain-containing protein [Spirochaetales bacterium]